MAIFRNEIHIHNHYHQGDIVTDEILNYLKMGKETLDSIKAVVDQQNAKLDIALPLITEVDKDLDYVVAKLDEGTANGLSAAEVQELKDYITNTTGAKVTEVKDKLTALEAEVDSSGTPPPPPPPPPDTL